MSMNKQNSVGFYEIVDRNLQPNTNYILTARMSTDYNKHKILSDQSAPVEFTSCKSMCSVLIVMNVCVLMLFNNPDQSICAPQPHLQMNYSKRWFRFYVLF